MNEVGKKCRKCGKYELMTDYKCGKRIEAQCRNCRLAANKEFRKTHPDPRSRAIHSLNHRKFMLRSIYGLTWERYLEMIEEQGGSCAVCRLADIGPNVMSKNSAIGKTIVDHDHKTGKVRGLLCSQCNSMLGFAEDDPGLLKEAIRYLQDGGWGPER